MVEIAPNGCWDMTRQSRQNAWILKVCFFARLRHIVEYTGGYRGGVKMGIFKCDSYNLCAKSFDAFYENEKARSVVEISSDEFSKNAKILYNLRLFKFSIANILQFLTFDSKSVSGPPFDQVIVFLWVFQTLILCFFFTIHCAMNCLFIRHFT